MAVQLTKVEPGEGRPGEAICSEHKIRYVFPQKPNCPMCTSDMKLARMRESLRGMNDLNDELSRKVQELSLKVSSLDSLNSCVAMASEEDLAWLDKFRAEYRDHDSLGLKAHFGSDGKPLGFLSIRGSDQIVGYKCRSLGGVLLVETFEATAEEHGSVQAIRLLSRALSTRGKS